MSQPIASTSLVRIQCEASAPFQTWLAQSAGSLLVSTYQAGKVALLGWDRQQVSLTMRGFDKPLGMAVSGGRIALATRNDLCLFSNAPLLAHDYLEDQPGRYDALYVPRATYHTGDLNTHDVVFEGDDLLFVNTRFSCLARVSTEFNFTPLWRPSFIDDLVPEDRCHLNGLAMRDKRPRYVTALGETNTVGGWREGKASGGVLIDIDSDEILVRGMSMPHSPRWHDDQLWVLNSGAGELCKVDPTTGQLDVVCQLPGYLRGLSFVGPYALIGLSKIREKHIFGGLPIQDKGISLRCGVALVDVRSGVQLGFFEYTSGCDELYDVVFLPGVRRPTILNFEKPVARQVMTTPDSSFWLRPSSLIRSESQKETLATDATTETPVSPLLMEQGRETV